MRFRSDEPEPRLLDEPRGPEAERLQLQSVPVEAPTRRDDPPFLIGAGVTGLPPRRARRASTRH